MLTAAEAELVCALRLIDPVDNINVDTIYVCVVLHHHASVSAGQKAPN